MSPKTAMRALVVRHYKTLNNEADLIMGWGDAPRARGWEGDLAWVDTLLRERGIGIDGLYSSRLKRARNTALYYAGRRGIDSIGVSKKLNEIHYGRNLIRKPKAWVAEHYPLHKKSPDFVYPGGESFAQMQRRSVGFVDELARNSPGKTLLLVVHAGVIRGLVCHFLGLDYGANLTRKIGHRYIGDFLIDQGRCLRYDEIGRPSGFVRDGRVSLPWIPEDQYNA